MSNVLSKMPNISIPRTASNQELNHATSLKHGFLYPIDCFEVIPGDSFTLDLSSLVRMSNPIVPIFGNIEMIVDAFFIPMRLMWSDAEKFYGDPSNHNKISSVTPVGLEDVQIPNWDYTSLVENSYGINDVADAVSYYLGKPILDPNTFTDSDKMPFISCLKERGYYIIWNEYYRPSGKIAPCLINTGSGSFNNIGTEPVSGDVLSYYGPVMHVCKKYDYFTAATLSPQFGDAVALPLGTYADVIGESAGTDTLGLPIPALHDAGAVAFAKGSTNYYDSSLRIAGYGGGSTNLTGGSLYSNDLTYTSSAASDLISKTNLVADLSQATAASINDIRFAFQVQKYLERSNYGSHFFEILNAHYGVTSPDGRLQRPDHLGHHKFYINVNQVLSTAGAADDDTTKLGQPGAVSVTGDRCKLFTGSFTEPGYIYVMVQTKYDRSYAGGILREDKRRYRLDFYSPEFANLGDQPIYTNELMTETSTGPVADDSVFGYQEHWAEYRYRKDRVSGILNPNLYSLAGIAVNDVWTLVDSFDKSTSEIELNEDFLFEDRESLARALVTGTDGPDYICDFHFKYRTVRELPFYSVPGLIDHFGAL